MLCLFNEADHSYRTDGVLLVPSVTGIIKECRSASYDQIRQDILENRRNLGAHVHTCTQYQDTGVRDESKVHAKAVPYLKAWEKFKREGRFIPQLIEEHVVEAISGMPLGGTPDRVGKLEGILCAVDIKISRQRERWWGVQTAGYAVLCAGGGLEVGKRTRRRVVQLSDDETYHIWNFNDPSDFDVLQWALALCWWKRNNGIITEPKGENFYGDGIYRATA